MAIVPTGSPAWSRTASHVFYGGDVNKRNFLSQGVVDPQTDVGAEEFSRMVADLECCARTAPFAVIRYRTNDAAPAAPTILSCYMMTGVNTTGYAGGSPPSGFPSAIRNNNGDVTFTFASSYVDAYSASGSFALNMAIANAATGTTSGLASTTILTPTTLRVLLFNSLGAAFSDVIGTVSVW